MTKNIFAYLGLLSLAAIPSAGQPSMPAIIEPAALTNAYLTINDFEEDVVASGRARIEANQLAVAFRSSESSPETQDAEGNWGPTSAGLRLSVRFQKTDYLIGEGISATVLLRNVSDQDRVFDATQPDWDFRFTVQDEHGNLLKDMDPTPRGDTQRFVSPRGLRIYVRTQRKFIVPLGPHFIIETPGRYSINVKARVRQANGSEPVEIISATGHIQIASFRNQTNAPSKTPK